MNALRRGARTRAPHSCVPRREADQIKEYSIRVEVLQCPPSFDPATDAGMNRALVKTFHGLTRNAQGKLVVSFLPIRNYASLCALEVLDESQ